MSQYEHNNHDLLMELEEVKQHRAVLLDALNVVLVQFGPYVDGEGAAKFHAINIANEAITFVEGK